MRKSILSGFFISLFVSSVSSWAQDIELQVDSALAKRVGTERGGDLTVLAPTLSPQEIDPAVLNRLMQEIAREPESTMRRLKIDEAKLQDIFISLSNARSFINNNEMASIRVMCDSYQNSGMSGDAQITEALAAYERRSDFTREFISKFYKIVLADIEYGLNQPALVSFRNYMDDRRRRMATAGTVTTGIPTHNSKSGAEAVEFHCRRNTP